MSDNDILDMIKKEISGNKILLFTKGTKEMPMCGFSARAIALCFRTCHPRSSVLRCR